MKLPLLWIAGMGIQWTIIGKGPLLFLHVDRHNDWVMFVARPA
jgi:hypothetical protein